VLEPVTGVIAGATSAALRSLLELVPLASVVPGNGDLRLHVAGGSGGFEVVVASACSGVTGIAGTLLVGVAAQYVLHGRRRARLLWLATAVALAWVLNLVRILLLLVVGRSAGESAALDLFHPVAGLLLLNVAFALLLLAAPRFGLRLSLQRRTPSDTPLSRPVPREQAMGAVTLARRFVVVAVAVGTLAVLNTTLPGTAAAYGPTGAPRPAFAAGATTVPGFVVSPAQEQTWATRYFGADSSWMRYRLTPASPQTRFSVWADSITTSEWGALRAHPVLTCYRFHGYDVLTAKRTVITAGLLADEVVYRNRDGGTWHVLSWEWPIRTPAGALAHERVTLLASSTAEDLAAAGDRPGVRGLRAGIAAHLSDDEPDDNPNPSLTVALRDTAHALLASRGED
jgi:exosortase/archaeosortase family protein